MGFNLHSYFFLSFVRSLFLSVRRFDIFVEKRQRWWWRRRRRRRRRFHRYLWCLESSIKCIKCAAAGVAVSGSLSLSPSLKV